MFFHLLTWSFEHLLAGWVVLEDYIFDPIAHQCKQWIERFRYGERETILPHYEEDWTYIIDMNHQPLEVQPLSQVRYIGTNGETYVLIQEDYFEPIDTYVYDAVWTTTGAVRVDVTRLLRQIAGPCGDMHGQELTLQDMVRFLAYNDERCHGPYTSVSRLQWTSGQTLTQYICSDWKEVLDFTIGVQMGEVDEISRNVHHVA
jgi:hypothetical protein